MHDPRIADLTLKLVRTTLLMLHSGLDSLAAMEPETLRGIARRESMRSLQRIIEQTLHVIVWAQDRKPTPTPEDTTH